MTTLLQSVLAISAAYLLHEVAHAAMGEFLGLRVKGVECSWRGIAVRLHRGPQWKNLLVHLAGPGFNLLMAAAAFRLLPHFYLANLVFGGVNLLPLPYSDGMQAMGILLQ